TEQMLNVFKNTTDWKGRTDLKSSSYAMSFQLMIVSLVIVYVSSSQVVDYGLGIKIIGYVILIYSLLSSVSFTTLLARRLRDTGINPIMFVITIWFTYILTGVFRFVTFFDNALNVFLPIMIYFIFHFFIIMMALLPSKEE
ncbi:MAG: hypothetical protein RBQ97_03820, partial [Acholeplasma sp.]|nr:hypothetical protein [Acholeplasma sp.]